MGHSYSPLSTETQKIEFYFYIRNCSTFFLRVLASVRTSEERKKVKIKKKQEEEKKEKMKK